MLELTNPITFHYYPHLISIYSAILIGAIAMHFYLKKIDRHNRNLILKRKVLQGLISVFTQASIYGFILLGARRIRMHLFSMEALHPLNLLIFTGATLYFLYRLKYGYPKKKKH